jgi:predicted nucleic-acid-binding protein
MIAADTNVWARAYLNDDVAQAMKARSVIEAECQHSGVFVPLIVLAELFWVLRSRWKKERVLQTLGHLLETDGIIVEAPTVVAKALKEARAPKLKPRIVAAGFADLLIAHVALANGASQVITFDKSFGRQPRVRRLT